MPDAASPEAGAFLRQMLWRRQLQAEPIVALLGPHGAGKGTALAGLSQECGGTVIHASLDLAAHDFDPIQAAAWISFELMRTWENTRRDPTFHRFALGLLARNEPLSSSRPLARRQVRDLVRQYVRDTPQGEAANRAAIAAGASLDVAVKSLGHLAGPPVMPAVLAGIRDNARPAIGSLFQRAVRLTIHDALDYYCAIPEAESAQPYDSLIQLSRASPDQAVKILLTALLADMAGNAQEHRPLRASCECVTPDGRPPERGHVHSWVLLVDGAQTPAGRSFLAGLAAARADRIRAGQLDPLLTVAACAQWDIDWHVRWCEPWSTSPRPGSGQQCIPLFSQATYEQWAAGSSAALAGGDRAAAWFPVWLDPLGPQRSARLVTPGATARDDLGLHRLAHRLTGGHLSALLALADQLAAVSSGTAGEVTVPSGVLVADMPARPPLWQRWARSNLPDALLSPASSWPAIPRTAAAAAYLADRQTAADQEVPGTVPDLQDVLDLLRQHLWISTFAAAPSRIRQVAAGGADLPAALHPWLARCLLGAAATAPRIRGQDGQPAAGQPPGPAWAPLFTLLARAFTGPSDEPQDTAARALRADRELYYKLALEAGRSRAEDQSAGGFAAVVDALARSFNTEDHRIWVGRLDYVTSAPCRLPVSLSTEDAYATLMAGQDGHTVIEVATAKLVALLWLYQDPLTEHCARWDHEIYESFDRLRSGSRRVDTSALKEAAACFPPTPARPAAPRHR
jgi:hypothetical protein